MRHLGIALFVFLSVTLPSTSFAQPSVGATAPSDASTDVPRDTGVVVDPISFPGPGTEIDPATLTSDNVYLERTSDSASIPANLSTDATHTIFTLQPVGLLDATTTYTFYVTGGLLDDTGESFVPFQMSFTTGTLPTGGNPSDAEFEKVALPTAAGAQFSSVTMGPDGQLYAVANTGAVWRWPVNADGTLGAAEVLTSLTDAEGGNRLAIGFVFDPASTAHNLIAWITHTTFGFGGMADWAGKVTRLSGPDLETVEDYIIRLPRSAKDHVTNGITFGPDGALYFLQGSNSAMGAPDGAWSNRSERLLTAACLRFDPSLVGAPPLDAKTEDDGTYDPYAPGAPLTIYAAGTRNAYDLVWHTNGELYIPTNGSASGGNTPGATGGESCGDGSMYGGPVIPALNGVGTQSDYLYRAQMGGYYGHPNPTRCQYVMNGGNPTAGGDVAEVTEYPVGTQPDAGYGGFAHDFGEHRSPNGVIEYTSGHFGGALQGKLLVVRYSSGNDIVALTPDATLDIGMEETGITGFTGFNSPLDLTENTANGHIYISEYGGSKLTLLRPIGVNDVAASPAELIYSGVQGAGPSDAQAVMIQNTGTSDLEVTGLALAGGDASDFQLVSPPAVPFTLGSGAMQTVDVVFSPAGGNVGPLAATLDISSDDPDEPLVQIGLYGLSAQGLEGNNEPPLNDVVTTLGHDIDVGGVQLALGTDPNPIGDEIEAELFRKAGPGVVTMTPVARYSPAWVLPFGYYEPNGLTPILNEVGQLSGSSSPPEHQTLFPEVITARTTGDSRTFDPGTTTFGFYTTSPSHSAYSEDALNAALHPSNVEHATRIYPLAGRTGTPVTDAYLVGFEEASNGDYQDYLFTVSNIEPAVSVPGPPAAPTNLVATAGDGQVGLGWDANLEVDLAGYNLYADTSSPVSTAGAPVNGGTLITDTSYTDTGLTNGTTYYYVVTAVDFDDEESGASNEASATPDVAPAVDVKINFQDSATVPPAGHVDDHGQAYGLRTEADQGSSTYTYGWIDVSTGTPISLELQGRNRGAGQPDLRLSTLIHMEHPSTPPTGYWEIAVPNGDYDVIVSVGDPSVGSDPEVHRINAEGVNIIDDFVPSGPVNSSTRHTMGSGTVTVTDGKLTLDYAGGGVNTKPNYVEIATAGGGMPSLAFDPSSLSFGLQEGANADSDTSNVTASDAGTPTVTITALDDSTGSAPTWLTVPASVTAGDDVPVDVDATGLSVGTYTATITGTAAGYVDGTLTASLDVTPGGCTFVSTLDCPVIPIPLPFVLEWDGVSRGSSAGLQDTDGEGTGFTMADPPSARLPVDGSPTFPGAPGYEPDSLDVDTSGSGTLRISATKGIAFNNPGGSTETNSQINALGVGFDASAQPLRVETTVLDLDFPSGNNFQQGGLWFGLDEATFIKMALINNGSGDAVTQLQIETGDSPGASFDGPALGLAATSTVTLALELDPVAFEVTGFYDVAGGASGSLGPITGVSAAFFDGALLSDGVTGPVSFAGVFGSKRRAPAGDVLVFTFDDFSIAPIAPPSLAFTPGALAFMLPEGTTSASDTTTASASDASTPTVMLAALDDTTGVAPTWLALPPSAVAGDPISADVDVTGLAPGTYTATVTGSAAGYTDGTFTVSLEVTPVVPTLDFSPAALAFALEEGTSTDSDTTTVTASDATTPLVMLAAVDDTTALAPTWLVLPASVTAGDDVVADVDVTGLAAGTYTATVTGSSAGYVDGVFTVALDVLPSGCVAISTLDCDLVPVSPPFALEFDSGARSALRGTGGGLVDTDGDGTGFTMVDPPSSRLPVDDPISNPFVPGYEPSLLDVDTIAGTLTITATQGIQFDDAGNNGNSQINALGVGFDASTTSHRIETRLLGPTFTASNSFQQAGIWFGLDEDRYVKLVVRKDTQFELLVETAPGSTTTAQSGGTTLGASVDLAIEIDPVAANVTGYYSIDGAPELSLGPIAVPAAFFAGELLSDGVTGPLSFAGVFGTKRNDASGSTQLFVFDSFSLAELGTPSLAFAPTSLSFSLLEGQASSDTSIVSASDASAPVVTLTAVDDTTGSAPGWLVVSASVTAPGDVAVDVDATGLTPGTFTATITGSAAGYTDGLLTVSLDVGVPTPPDPVADVTAAQVLAGNDTSGTTGVTITWTGSVDPEDTVEVYRKGYGGYPEYDDAGGTGVPAQPATRAAALGDGWTLTNVSSSGGVDQAGARDEWYYVAFVVDPFDQESAPSNVSNGALGYHLGDVASGGDNVVDFLDISVLGAAYGTTDGDASYNPAMDVGPTVDGSTTTRPTTDDAVEFDDLVVIAINFQAVNLARPASGQPRLALVPDDRLEIGERYDVALHLEAAGDLRAVSLALDWDPNVVRPGGVRIGDLAERQATELVVFSPEPGTVDAAALGAPITGAGVLAVVTFEVVGLGDAAVGVSAIDARDGENASVDVTLDLEAIANAAPPAATRLLPAMPNPFRASTAIGFDIAGGGETTLSIFSVDGRLVRTLVDAALPPGAYRLAWDGRDESGRTVSSGIYLLRLVTPDLTSARRVVRIR